MSNINDFDDLLAWQSARRLAVKMDLLSKGGKFSTNHSLKEQIRRASISVVSNIAEGFGRGGNKEFIHFLSVARGSLAEIKSQIILANDFGYLEKEEFEETLTILVDTGRLIGGLIRHLKKAKISGSKFKKVEDKEISET
jgi:four helix bundle protein